MFKENMDCVDLQLSRILLQAKIQTIVEFHGRKKKHKNKQKTTTPSSPKTQQKVL